MRHLHRLAIGKLPRAGQAYLDHFDQPFDSRRVAKCGSGQIRPLASASGLAVAQRAMAFVEFSPRARSAADCAAVWVAIPAPRIANNTKGAFTIFEIITFRSQL
jgi:hypothetical protein